MRLFVTAAAGVGLIIFLTLLVARLIRSRWQGLSVRMQVFLALAGIVGAFALGLGLLVVDRVDARAERLARAAAQEESSTIATLLQSEMLRTGVNMAVLIEQLEARDDDTDLPSNSMESMGLELL